MDIELIKGRFSKKEAELLLTSIFNAKIHFHESKIKMLNLSEEEIDRSEKKIAVLNERLNKLIKKISESDKEYTDMNAHIEISFAPVLTH